MIGSAAMAHSPGQNGADRRRRRWQKQRAASTRLAKNDQNENISQPAPLAEPHGRAHFANAAGNESRPRAFYAAEAGSDYRMAHQFADALDDFAMAVLAGLAQSKKSIPARFFYDQTGSELFEEITRLPEYYPTRVETGLLQHHAGAIADLAGVGRALIEFGSGSSTKTPLLLEALKPPVYVPIDISNDFLHASADVLARAYRQIRVEPVAGDFTAPLRLPVLPRPLVGFFPGSTLGNFPHAAAVDLLRSFRETLGSGARLVIGLDTRKDQALLEAAYNDAAGVTAAFNLNLLHRINRELGGTVPVDAFVHKAIWNDRLGRIEMHLFAIRDVRFHAAGQSFEMAEGESIHTENSYKYTPEEARLLARAAGWEPQASWFDEAQMFGVHVWAANGDMIEP
jgi:L-histidine N-alpha-methyltransferase